jgi:hypothetical protein
MTPPPAHDIQQNAGARITATYVQNLKRKAKTMSRAPGVVYVRALDMVAIEDGFKNWQDVAAQHKAHLATQTGSAS